MKFLHISDLHIGKRLNGVPLLHDQISVLDQIADIAIREAVDAVLIAGDVYQKSSPQSGAMAAFSDFLSKLVSRGIKVFIISGNHDSEQHISYFSSLVRSSGVWVSEEFDGRLQTVELDDEFGELTVSLLPYIKPANVKKFFPDRQTDSYQDAVSAVLENSETVFSKRNVLLCHQFVTGAELSDSEEFSVGGLENISAALFDGFDYVAMGHIHKPQSIGRKTLRYAGSMMKYSFSEAKHKKSVTFVELREKGDVDVREIKLTAPHDVREISGSLEELLDMPYSEDYVRASLTDELIAPDAAVTLSTVFPNLMELRVCNSKSGETLEYTAAESIRGKTVEELFRDFYRMQNNSAEPDEAHIALLREILSGLEANTDETD